MRPIKKTSTVYMIVYWHPSKAGKVRKIKIKGQFRNQTEGEEYSEIYQEYLRTIQKIYNHDGNPTDVRICSEDQVIELPGAFLTIHYGTMVPLEVLLGKPKEKQ